MDPVPSTFVGSTRPHRAESTFNASDEWTRPSGCISSLLAVNSSAVKDVPRIPNIFADRRLPDHSTDSSLQLIFVLSESGKLVFYRGGVEEQILGLCGVVLTLVSIAEATPGNKLNSIRSKNVSIVFSHRYSLIIVAVMRELPGPHTYRLLDFMFDQILSILTLDYVQDVFLKRKNCDLRAILSGTERLLSNVVDFADDDFGFLVNAVYSLPININFRQQIDSVMSLYLKNKGIIFGFLFCDKQLVSLTRFEKYSLHPSDLHLIVNLVCNSNSFKDVESWIPICLPRFDASGFLYAYIAFLDKNSLIYEVVLTVDRDSFHELSRMKNTIYEKLSKSRLLSAIKSASKEKHMFSLVDIGVKEDVRHFLYKTKLLSQYVSSVPLPYNTETCRKHLCSVYKRIRDKMISNSLTVLCETNDEETVLGWISVSFELFVTVGPFVTKSAALSAVASLTRWIKKMEPHSFI